MYTYHIFFMHNGHLGCFHVLAIVNGAADTGQALSKVQALVHIVQKEFE